MDDSAVVWTLGGVITLALVCLAALAIIDVAFWYTTCPHTTTTCDCNGDYPVQCNYQCYHSWKCTCDDLDDLKSVRSNIESWVAKKNRNPGGDTPAPRTTGSHSGDIPGVPDAGTGTGDPADAGTGDPSGTGTGSDPGSSGSDGQAPNDWSAGGKIAGLTDNGEFWISNDFQQQHCQGLSDTLYTHEMVHKGDDTCRNPASFAWQVISSMLNKNYAAQQQDRSEFSAYASQTADLDNRIAALQATCSNVYKCSYSGKSFDDVQECIAACPCSLAHPCAGFGHCIEYNSETGEKTGRKY